MVNNNHSKDVVSNVSYSVMTNEDKAEFDDYVINIFYDITLSYGLNPSILTVKEGIEVVNLKNAGCFYPVYENGELTYSLEIYKIDGEFGFSFPGNSIDDIKQLFAISDKEFSIFAVYDRIYGYTGKYVIDFRTHELIKLKNFSYNVPDLSTYSNNTIIFSENYSNLNDKPANKKQVFF